MRTLRETTKYQGVYQRQFKDRRDPRDGKPDICFDITYRVNGRKIWEKVGFKSEGFTAQVARELRVERMQSALHGEPSPKPSPNTASEAMPEIVTLGDAWKLYSEKWLPNNSRPINELSRYNLHLSPRFGDSPLKEIKPLDLETFKQELLAKGLASKTAHHVLCLIRAIYNKMKEWGIYNGPIPTEKIKMPKIDNARVRYLTVEEADRLLAYLKPRSLTWWRMASISLNTGLRLGEILALTYGDLDLAAGVIHVRDAKAGTRMAHMNTTMKILFSEMPPGQPSSLLFPSKDGKKRTGLDISKTFARAINGLKLNENVTDARQKVVFHTLRHTFASWLAIEGVPLYTISELMGHATLEMTKRYAHLCPDSKREAVAKIAGRTNAFNAETKF